MANRFLFLLCAAISLSSLDSISADQPVADATSEQTAARNPALSRYRRMLLKGSARGHLKALTAVRDRFLEEQEVPSLLVEFLDPKLANEIKRNKVTTVSLLAIETLGATTPTEDSREGLIRWTRLATPEDRPAAESQAAAKIEDRYVAFQTLMMALRAHEHEDVVGLAIELLKHQDYRVQILAIDLLGRQADPQAQDHFAVCIESEHFLKHYAYRHALIDATMRLEDSESRPLLETALPRLNGLLWRVVQNHLLLQRSVAPQEKPEALVISNRSLRGTPNGARTEQAFTTELQTGQLTKIPYRAPSFFGLPIYADKVTFVVDCSSTMQHPLPSGISRIEQAKIELANAVSALAPNQSFRVIGFNSQVASLSPTLVAATPLNKRRFVRQLSLLNAKGGTNLYGGLVAAIRDVHQPEMIVLLSDGTPTAGEIREPGEIIRAIDYQNLFRRVAISTVSIGPESNLMIRLSERSGGSHRRVGN